MGLRCVSPPKTRPFDEREGDSLTDEPEEKPQPILGLFRVKAAPEYVTKGVGTYELELLAEVTPIVAPLSDTPQSGQHRS